MNISSLGNLELPKLKSPVFIAGFDGWGNALNVSKGMADYLIKQMSATFLAEFCADFYFRYDAARPNVLIENGTFKSFDPPQIKLYVAKTRQNERDLIILTGDEPNLAWQGFAKELFDFLESADIKTVYSAGSMYDNVLHTERVISGFVSTLKDQNLLIENNVQLISYNGPGSIHSIIHDEGRKRNITCVSLWCHCPYYIQGATHFGNISRLARLLSVLGNFSLDTEDLETEWKKLDEEIDMLIKVNPDLQTTVEDLKKERKKNLTGFNRKLDGSGKIINLEDFLGPQ